MHFERGNAFQNALKNSPKKIIIKKNVFQPYIKFSDTLPGIHLSFYLALSIQFQFFSYLSE